MISANPAYVRTIEIRPAQVHLTGSFAGLIEIPIVLPDEAKCLGYDLDELYLEVAGEDRLLRPMGRAYVAGGLNLAFFSNVVRESGELPAHLTLQWIEPQSSNRGGMDLCVQKAG